MDLLDDARAMQADLVQLRRKLHREPPQAVFDEDVLSSGAALHAKLALDRLA